MESRKFSLNGKAYQLVTIDFETYYDDDYTLSKGLNTSEYIRDDRFKAHGVGIKIDDGDTVWHTGKNIKPALEAIDWTKSAMVGHNISFDGFIASHVYKIVPALYIDTLSMARGAHGHHMRHNLDTIAKAHGLVGKAKAGALTNTKGKVKLTASELRNLGLYCVDDVNDTYEIFWKLYNSIPDDELEIIDITVKMFCAPVLRIDIPRVEAELAAEISEKSTAVEACGATVEELMSNNKFAEKIAALGIAVPVKISPTTGKDAFAFAKTDEGLQELLNHKNPAVAALAKARLKVKSTIGETRAIRFLEAGKNGMRLPVLLNYAGAHTHRWSGGNKMNLQNLKRKGELRKAILAPEGHVVVVADSAQIEARVLAWFAEQEDVVAAFRNKRDLYSEFATKLFGYPVNRKATAIDENGKEYHPQELEGFVGKVCLGADTLVLTNSGWKPILYVSSKDKVWDGIEWVSNQGLIYKGQQPTLTSMGVTLTPDHEVLTGDLFHTWKEVLTNPFLQQSALRLATLPSSNGLTKIELGTPKLDVHALESILLTDKICLKENPPDAISAQKQQVPKNDMSVTALSATTKELEVGFSTECLLAYNDAIAQSVNITSIMDYAELLFSLYGGRTGENFLDTSSLFRDILIQNSNSIELTSIAGTPPETSDLLATKSTWEINDGLLTLNLKSVTSRLKTHVFDLVNCGPRSRFTILTAEGPMIVSNCVLGLGYGMGHTKLRATLASGGMGMKVNLTEKQCLAAVSLYRNTNHNIRALWKKMDGVIESMLVGTPGELSPISYGKGFIRLPNTMFLQYFGLHANVEVTRGGLIVNEASYVTRSGRAKIYGGLLTENVVQALARCIIAKQMLAISKKYKVVTTTHDEIVAVCPKDQAEECLKDMLQIMSTPPTWALDLPLAAEGGYDVCYSK